MCADPTCKTSARFNQPGTARGIFCSKHKAEGMVDVVHQRCSTEGCNVLASFNVQARQRGSTLSLSVDV